MSPIQIKPYQTLQDENYFEPCIILIEQTNFDKIVFHEGRYVFQIRNCHFTSLKIENFEDIIFEQISIGFIECYINQVDVDDILSKNISVDFDSCVLSGRARSSNIQSIEIRNCLLVSTFFLLNLNQVHIYFDEYTIKPSTWKTFFRKFNLKFNILKEVKQGYYVYDCIKVKFELKQEKKQSTVIYRRSKERLEEFKVGYSLRSEKEHFHIRLSIKYGLDVQDLETKIENGYLEALTLSGTSKGKIEIENTQILNWYLHNFKPKGEATFYDISPTIVHYDPSKIEFHQCNLDNTSFDNINFLDFSKISFYRTKLSKTLFTSCNFPNSYKQFENFTSLKNIHYNLKRDSYRKDLYEIFIQLKMAFSSTGNFYEAQKIQAVANEALRKVKGLSISDKIILCLNNFSNNHGISIRRPVFWFFIFSISLYIFYLKSLGRIFINTPIDYTLFGYYFSFIDITHKLDFLVDKSEFNFFSLTIDFLNKILVGYLIYQFVAAFRKYGKSNSSSS